MSDIPTVHNIRRVTGIAGQVSYVVRVQYDGEEEMTTQFVGQLGETGGPVVAINPNGHQMFVTDPARFGAFGPEWVRRFFA